MLKRKQKFLKEFKYDSDIMPQVADSKTKSAGSFATAFQSFHTAQNNA